MKKLVSISLSFLIAVSMAVPPVGADLNPVVGLTLFGGAERGNDEHAGGIGGGEVFGLLPISKQWGLQGSLLNQGGNGDYKLGLSLGPVFAYSSGKVGLFGDYVYRDRGDNNFFYLRGVWSHYFDNFDLVLSYSQPVNSVQHTRVTLIGGCGLTRKASEPAINELKGMVRYYPTPKIELNAGLLVNSFAGPDRNQTGTGFGGVFGAAIQVLDWLILRPVQGQMDTRERYRVTSGIEFVWTPAQAQEPPSRQHVQDRDAAFSVASSASC